MSKEHSNVICFNKQKILWRYPKDSTHVLEACGLQNYRLKAPELKRIKHIEQALYQLQDDFKDEIQFIFNNTKTLCWVESENDSYIGNAAYFEAPHCTFFSDAALFSIPPETVVPRPFSEFAVLENLYHESLHHHMHSLSATTKGYLIDNASDVSSIQLDWRTRDFSLLEALHALIVYAFVTPMRLTYFKRVEKNYNATDLQWLTQAIEAGFRMWQDLLTPLEINIELFKTDWKEQIIGCRKEKEKIYGLFE